LEVEVLVRRGWEFSQASKGKTRDLVARCVGMSGRTRQEARNKHIFDFWLACHTQERG